MFRVVTFALGMPTAVLSTLYTAFILAYFITFGHPPMLSLPLLAWVSLVGFFWLNSFIIGAWYNVAFAAQLDALQKVHEVVKVLALAPLAGAAESTAALWAVVRWTTGHRGVNWTPTPKTSFADRKVTSQPAPASPR